MSDEVALRRLVERWAVHCTSSGRWGLVRRQPIYERDRLDPVTPGEVPRLAR